MGYPILMTMNPDVRQAADRANDSAVVEWGARLGYAANGLIHLLIAWIAAQVALGSGGGQNADQSGALATLAKESYGQVLLWVAVAAFTLLVVWEITEAVLRHETGDRVKAAAKAVAYGALGWTAFTFASGGHSSSSKTTKDFTATLMNAPGGQLLVGAVGAGIVAIGGYHVYKGWTKKFMEDLKEHPGRFATVAGRVGYIAKGVALGVVGFLFVVAAVQHRSGKATGLDGALRTLRDAPAGTVLLLLVALGIAAFGVYSFTRARYARV